MTWKLELKWMPLCETSGKNAAYTQVHALVDLPNSAVESIRSISGNPTFSTRASSITMYCHVLPCITMYYHVLPCIAMYYHVLPCITMSYHVLPCITMYDLYSSHPKALFWLHPLKSRHLRHDSPGTTTSSSPGLESEVESATS